jgi:hypothetical protein
MKKIAELTVCDYCGEVIETDYPDGPTMIKKENTAFGTMPDLDCFIADLKQWHIAHEVAF